jgi:serine/threonine-protein kinase RIO1
MKKIGNRARSTLWVHHEYEVVEALYSAGTDTPKPYIRGQKIIIMEYIEDAYEAASPLKCITLDNNQAKTLYKMLIPTSSNPLQLIYARKMQH